MRQCSGGHHVGGARPDRARADHGSPAAKLLCERDGGMRHGLFIMRAIRGEFVPRGIQCLAEAGMSFSDLVRINAYVTDRAHMAPYMQVRDRYVAMPAPASTLMIVGGFTRPEFTVEIEALAAK